MALGGDVEASHDHLRRVVAAHGVDRQGEAFTLDVTGHVQGTFPGRVRLRDVHLGALAHRGLARTSPPARRAEAQARTTPFRRSPAAATSRPS